jgi:hypothetical protein
VTEDRSALAAIMVFGNPLSFSRKERPPDSSGNADHAKTIFGVALLLGDAIRLKRQLPLSTKYACCAFSCMPHFIYG